MGAIRLYLALGVVFAHTTHEVVHHVGMSTDNAWWLNVVGGRAVIFFYIVSGFLISYALHEKYPRTTAGTVAFFRSRFLRIFPLWWVLLIVCLLINIPPWPSPHSPLMVAPAALLFGTDWLVTFWNYPQRYWGFYPHALGIGWTLGAELTFYLIAPWALRSGRIAFALLLMSAMVRLGVGAFNQAGPSPSYITWGYFFFPATLVYFLIGHFANVIARFLPLGTVTSVVALVFAVFFSWLEPVTVDPMPSYLSCACFAAALPGLFAVTKDSPAFNFLGDLTYPLYLTHIMTVATLIGPWGFAAWLGRPLLASAAYFASPAIGGGVLVASIMCIAIPVAAAVHFAVERPSRRLVNMILLRCFSDRPLPAEA